MTIYIILQCSKRKSLEPQSDLIWSEKTNIENWHHAWKNAKVRQVAKKLYSGRAIKREIELVESIKGARLFVISAGAGLVDLEERIPSYESTFLPARGPKISEWAKLPHGGLTNLSVDVNDTIVSFAARNYHKALLEDPEFNALASNFVVAHTSPIAAADGASSVIVHPRAAEYLGVAHVDLNSELLKLYLTSGGNGFKKMHEECDKLPPPAIRTSISDEDLMALIQSLESISSIVETVRYIRHHLGIKASYERIRDIIYKLR